MGSDVRVGLFLYMTMVPSCAPSALRARGSLSLRVGFGCRWNSLFCPFVNKEGNPKCFSRLSVLCLIRGTVEGSEGIWGQFVGTQQAHAPDAFSRCLLLMPLLSERCKGSPAGSPSFHHRFPRTSEAWRVSFWRCKELGGTWAALRQMLSAALDRVPDSALEAV